MTKASVFIIESLTFEDEKNERFEGKFLSHILKLGGIETKYFYIRTKKEFKEVLNNFYDSKFRYLHISCHGDRKSLSLTLDDISHRESGRFDELVQDEIESLRDNENKVVKKSTIIPEKFWGLLIPLMAYITSYGQ